MREGLKGDGHLSVKGKQLGKVLRAQTHSSGGQARCPQDFGTAHLWQASCYRDCRSEASALIGNRRRAMQRHSYA